MLYCPVTPAISPATPKPRPPLRSRLFADITPLRTSVHYRRLWFGNTVSWVGQQMTALAVSLQVYDLTGSTFAVGAVGLCSLVPLIVFGLYGGAIADTVDRRKLGMYTAVGATVLSVALAAAALLDVRQVWVLYTVVALQAVCFAMNSPARSSMIPRLLPPEQLPAANALNSLTSNLGMMGGPMLGGVFVGLWGYQAAYLIDVVTFTAALYAMWRLPAMRPDHGGEDGPRRPSVLEGLRFLATRPNLRMTFFADLAAMVLAQPGRCSPRSPCSGSAATRRRWGCWSLRPRSARCSARCSPAGSVRSAGTAWPSWSRSSPGERPSPASASPATCGSACSSSPSPAAPTPSPWSSVAPCSRPPRRTGCAAASRACSSSWSRVAPGSATS